MNAGRISEARETVKRLGVSKEVSLPGERRITTRMLFSQADQS